MADPQSTDKWAAWLLHRRDGDDAEQRAKTLEHLLPIRRRVLDNAAIASGNTVLDVGAGDGLIAFGALDHVGTEGHVILSDISEDLVSHARSIAEQLDVADARMSFVRAGATDLSPIRDASVDVVTTRSVLIYVDDKAGAFRAFHRVLRRGGRISIFEPINNYFPDSSDDFFGFDARPIRDLVAKVWAYEGWLGHDADDPMMNFTEKDLLRCAEDAGFDEVHIELLVDAQPGTWVVDWDRLLNTSPNPNARTAGEMLRGALTQREFDRVEEHIRPLADAGQGTLRTAFAYLRAVKGRSE